MPGDRNQGITRYSYSCLEISIVQVNYPSLVIRQLLLLRGAVSALARLTRKYIPCMHARSHTHSPPHTLTHTNSHSVHIDPHTVPYTRIDVHTTTFTHSYRHAHMLAHSLSHTHTQPP